MHTKINIKFILRYEWKDETITVLVFRFRYRRKLLNKLNNYAPKINKVFIILCNIVYAGCRAG